MNTPHKILLGVTIGLAAVACSEDAGPPTEPALRPVRVELVSRNGDLRERSFTGVSRSTQESRMSFKVSGTVTDVPVQVGDRLQSGALIARLNTSTFDLTVQQAEASLAQARASQRNADASYSRTKELYTNNNASRNDLDSARANAESAAAQVRSAAKSLEIARLDRSYTRLTAPTDCRVAAVDIEINENVSAGTQVATVNCGSGIEVSLGVPESLIGGLEQGMEARVRFNALPNEAFAGRLTEVGVASVGNSATFPIVVTLEDSVSSLRPGMAADVTFEFRNLLADVHAVPSTAVMNDEQGSYVFVAVPTDNGQAEIERRSVATGELTANGVEILEGLVNGDRVVTAGTTVIRSGQRVLLPEG